MRDSFGRTINYLRISVTDRCNLRCRYCMPPEGVQLLPREAILSFDEIFEVAQAAANIGFIKLRLTGGEPLVRRDIEVLVEMLAGIETIQDLAMSTNGTLLADHADALAAAGLQRVNISLDALNPEHYTEITGGGHLPDVLAGIEAARLAGLCPIKLNCVVAESSAEPDAVDVARFAHDNDLQIRFIHQMDLPTGKFSVVEGGSGGDCPHCNRLRLSSDGMIRPCLFSDLAFSVRELGPEQALRQAIREKPEAGVPCTHNWMRGIGG
jgi:GTP 3',8-cyclase